MKVGLSLLAAAVVATHAGYSSAQNYPNRPVRIVVPFSPGGGNDIVARFAAQRMTEAFGQTAIVDNRPGAGSTVGTDVVAKSTPDGYTLLVTHNAIAINETLYPKLPYDAERDFAQVILVGSTTNTLVVNAKVAAKSTKELIALAKSKPGALNYSSTGAGGTSHLAMEYFKLATGTNLVHIPYKGTGPALADLVGGQVQVMISALPGTIPFIQGKRLVALATTGAKRSAFLPELPTLAESGVPGYEFDTWYGLHAPAKVPKDVIAKLNATLGKSLSTPAVKEQLFKAGLEAEGGTPEAFRKFMVSEIQKMSKIIKASGAKPEV
ncbi:MAG TPA: tripartite tricarboxylate transporter substrate binding protein [Burkholderiales bacterium]|nr:tripartite tricarboxylate transporter substrate binding protein [Burkholderiales bacterium]